MLNAGKWCKASQAGVFFLFFERERSAPCRRASCAALYAPIDKIKEQRDESGAKQRVRGRGAGGCFMSLTSYEGD